MYDSLFKKYKNSRGLHFPLFISSIDKRRDGSSPIDKNSLGTRVEVSKRYIYIWKKITKNYVIHPPVAADPLEI